jgi:hypothetical protein
LVRVYREALPARLVVKAIVGVTLLAIILSIVLITAQYAMWSFSSVETAFHPSGLFNPAEDRSFAEQVMRGVSLMTAICFLLSYVVTKRRVLLALSAVYGFVWVDDMFLYHERAGTKIAEMFNLQYQFGLRGQDFGEITAWFIAGLGLAVMFAWALLRSELRDVSLLLLVAPAFAMLAFFGLVVDMLHVMFEEQVGLLLGLIEDCGEMLAVAFAGSMSVLVFAWLVGQPAEAAQTGR